MIGFRVVSTIGPPTERHDAVRAWDSGGGTSLGPGDAMQHSLSMSRRSLQLGVLALWLESVARACPVCHSSNGAQLRMLLFGGNFWNGVLLCALPFPFFLAIVTAAYYAFPLPGSSTKGARA